MNSFRVTILVFLAVALGVLFWIVAFLLPKTQQISDEQKREQESSHYDKLLTHGSEKKDAPAAATQSGTDILKEDQAAKDRAEIERLRKELELKKEEEEVLKKGASANSSSVPAAATAENVAPVAVVSYYDKENNIVLLQPQGNQELSTSQVLAVSRFGGIVCELVLQRFDPESGLYSAAMKKVDLITNPTMMQVASMASDPKVDDKVIISPLPQVSDLPSLNSAAPAAATPAPAALPQGNSKMSDVVEVPLTPALP